MSVCSERGPVEGIKSYDSGTSMLSCVHYSIARSKPKLVLLFLAMVKFCVCSLMEAGPQVPNKIMLLSNGAENQHADKGKWGHPGSSVPKEEHRPASFSSSIHICDPLLSLPVAYTAQFHAQM